MGLGELNPACEPSLSKFIDGLLILLSTKNSDYSNCGKTLPKAGTGNIPRFNIGFQNFTYGEGLASVIDVRCFEFATRLHARIYQGAVHAVVLE